METPNSKQSIDKNDSHFKLNSPLSMIETKVLDFGIKNNYYELCSRMILCYEEMTLKLKDERIQKAMEKEVLVIFGPTRSGKSTFLLRVASEMSSDDFKEKMYDTNLHDGVIKKYENIEVASGNLAVTMIPNLYILGNRLVVDLAGFDDLTPNRRPIISLLNYSLLSKIPNVKMLTVISLGSLAGSEINGSVRRYFSQYVDLVTKDHVELALSSSVFIVTKTDTFNRALMIEGKSNNIEDAYLRHVGTFALDLASQDKLLSQIASTMARNKILIDYDDKKDNIIKSLDDKLNRMVPINAKLLNLDITSISSEIVTECAKVIEKYYEFIEKIKNDKQKLEFSLKTYQTILIDVNKNKDQIIINMTNNGKLQVSIIEKDGEITNCDRQIKDNELRKKQLDDEFQDLKIQRESFEKKNSDFDLLSINICHSTAKKNENKICFEFNRPPGSLDQTTFIIITREEFSNNDKKIMSCSNIRALLNLQLKNLIHDVGVKKADINIVTEKQNLIITTKLKMSHTLILLNTISVKDTPLVKLIYGHFDDKKEQINKTQIVLLEDKKRIIKEKDLLLSHKTELLDKISSNDKNNTDLLDKSETKLHYITNKLQEFKNSVDNSISFIEELFQNPILLITIRLGEILLECRIGVTFLEKIKYYKADYDTYIKNFRVLDNGCILSLDNTTKLKESINKLKQNESKN
jgi:hypothetical protein